MLEAAAGSTEQHYQPVVLSGDFRNSRMDDKLDLTCRPQCPFCFCVECAPGQVKFLGQSLGGLDRESLEYS